MLRNALAVQDAAAAEATAVARCIAVAALADVTPAQRQRAATLAVDGYERAACLVDAVLAEALRGPCPGLLAVMEAASVAAGRQRCGALSEAAHAVAAHAHDAALDREARVWNDLALPHLLRCLEPAHAAD